MQTKAVGEIRVVNVCNYDAFSRVSKFLTRTLTFNPPHNFWTAGQIYFINISIKESSSIHSSILVDERNKVDRILSELHQELDQKVLGRKPFLMWDTSGHPLSVKSNVNLDLLDLIECMPESGIFNTIELGCCRTYSHIVLKTRCLSGILIVPFEPSDGISVQSEIVQILENL